MFTPAECAQLFAEVESHQFASTAADSLLSKLNGIVAALQTNASGVLVQRAIVTGVQREARYGDESGDELMHAILERIQRE